MVEVRMSRKEALSILELEEPTGKRATEEEIKASYRRLALTNHPDRNANTPESTIAFQRIANAYQRLMTSYGGEDDVDENKEKFISKVDALALFNAIAKSSNPLLAAMLFFSATRQQQSQFQSQQYSTTTEDLIRASKEDAAGRAELLLRIELGFNENQNIFAKILRESDNPNLLSKAIEKENNALEQNLGLGNTISHFACYFGREKCIQMLALKSVNGLIGVLNDKRNEDGLTPLDVAKRQCHFDLVERLEISAGIKRKEIMQPCRFFHPPKSQQQNGPSELQQSSNAQEKRKTAEEYILESRLRSEEIIAKERAEEERRIIDERKKEEDQISALRRQEQEMNSLISGNSSNNSNDNDNNEIQFSWMKDYEAALERASTSVGESTSRVSDQ